MKHNQQFGTNNHFFGHSPECLCFDLAPERECFVLTGIAVYFKTNLLKKLEANL